MKTSNRFCSTFPLLGLIALMTVTACDIGQKIAARDPKISDLVIDGETMPEINRIKVPMPATLPANALKRAQAASLWQPAARSLFLDQRAEDVGDILTIIININDKAQLKNASARSRTESEATDSPVFFGYGGMIDRILPGVGSGDLPTGGQIVDLGSTSSADGEGSIKRNESIQLKIAGMVVQLLPNGNLVIAGRQEVKVNNELRELRVAGIIRPEDISPTNTISYEKIAEARISYGGRGQISQVQTPRAGLNFLDIILPY